MRGLFVLLVVSTCASSLAQLSATGRWSPVVPLPVVPINQILLPNGKILMYGYGQLADYPTLYNPDTGQYRSLGALPSDVFCSGHTILSDGSVLIAGGEEMLNGWGTRDAYIYNPYDGPDGRFYRVGSMEQERWYPTLTTLPDGRVISVGGSIRLDPGDIRVWAAKTERFDPESLAWVTTTEDQRQLGYYPFLHVIPDGRVLFGSQIWNSTVYDPATGLWQNYGLPATNCYGMSSVSFSPGRILKSGGDVSPTDATGSRWAARWEVGANGPAWTTVPNMLRERREHDLTVLPDGRVLCTGGSKLFNSPETAVYEAEMFDPANNSWTLLPPHVRPRSYHSSALLLRDGRVFVAGGGTGGGRRQNAVQDELNGEFYSPGYLFRSARPVVGGCPKTVNYGTQFSVYLSSPQTISGISIIAPGAVTHGFDMNQRRVPLSFSQRGSTLTVSAPANANLAPPGPYMLFVLNSQGVPSVGRWIYFNAPLMAAPPLWNDPERGSWVSGNDASLVHSDDNRLVFRPVAGAAPNLIVRFGQTSPKRHISTMVVSFESRAGGGQWVVEGYSYRTLAWTKIASGNETIADSVKRVEIIEDAKRYVDQNPSLRHFDLRIKWNLNGAPATDIAIDRIRIEINK